MSIPDIRRDGRAWFRYFDRDRTGSLDVDEVCCAFIATFGGACDPAVLTSVVHELWPLFDRDGSGSITEQEFVAREGLCDTICAQMPLQPAPHVRELNPSHAQAPQITLHCWSCQRASGVRPPLGPPTPFVAICPYCQQQNQVQV